MANKRDIKKMITTMCESLAFNCIIAAETVPGIDSDAMYKLVNEISALQVAAIDRCTFAYDRKASSFDNRKDYNKARHQHVKGAYAVLLKDFNEKVVEIVKKMNALLPEEQRKINKALAMAD